MKKTKFKFVRAIVRVFSFLLAGILVSIAMVSNMDTYSWFTSKMMVNAIARAATTSDIIDEIDLYGCDNKERNPEGLILSRKDGLDYDPVAFFEINGEISNYMLHINPVRLSGNGPISIPFRFGTKLVNFIGLYFRNKNDIISGIIKVKHFNEYIDEEIPIKFTVGFLRTKCKLDDMKTDLEIDFIDEDDITDLIIYIASYKNWGTSGTADITQAGIMQAGESDSGNGTAFNMAPFLMDADQSRIVDVIIPGLRRYLEEIYSTNQKLIEELSKKMAEYAELDEKYNNIVSEIERLEKENKALREAIDALTAKSNDNEDNGESDDESGDSNTEGGGNNTGDNTENGNLNNSENNLIPGGSSGGSGNDGDGNGEDGNEEGGNEGGESLEGGTVE
ncbi:MAG TPA: SIKE family protein [Clostridiaceae bacterium]|nr:SIKE family protein [Clostridiaceae bacterium]